MPRDSSGNYTLPAGNPVVDGTIIATGWANPTMSDIATQLNNVLTRDGLLGPVAPLLIVDGTPAQPGLAFNSQIGTGWWRDATKVGFSYAGASQFTMNASGVTLNNAPTAPGLKTSGGTLTLTGGTPAGSILLGDTAGSGSFLYPAVAGGSSLGTSALPWGNMSLSGELGLSGELPITFSGTNPVLIWRRTGEEPPGAIIQRVGTDLLLRSTAGAVLFQVNAGVQQIDYDGSRLAPQTAYGAALGNPTLPWSTAHSSGYFVRSGAAAVGELAFDGGLALSTEPGQPLRFIVADIERMNFATNGSIAVYGNVNVSGWITQVSFNSLPSVGITGVGSVATGAHVASGTGGGLATVWGFDTAGKSFAALFVIGVQVSGGDGTPSVAFVPGPITGPGTLPDISFSNSAGNLIMSVGGGSVNQTYVQLSGGFGS